LGESALIVNMLNPRPIDLVSNQFTGSWELNLGNIFTSRYDCKHSCEGDSSELLSSRGRVAFLKALLTVKLVIRD
jgi:hypothetical protein